MCACVLVPHLCQTMFSLLRLMRIVPEVQLAMVSSQSSVASLLSDAVN